MSAGVLAGGGTVTVPVPKDEPMPLALDGVTCVESDELTDVVADELMDAGAVELMDAGVDVKEFNECGTSPGGSHWVATAWTPLSGRG